MMSAWKCEKGWEATRLRRVGLEGPLEEVLDARGGARRGGGVVGRHCVGVWCYWLLSNDTINSSGERGRDGTTQAYIIRRGKRVCPAHQLLDCDATVTVSVPALDRRHSSFLNRPRSFEFRRNLRVAIRG